MGMFSLRGFFPRFIVFPYAGYAKHVVRPLEAEEEQRWSHDAEISDLFNNDLWMAWGCQACMSLYGLCPTPTQVWCLE